MKIKIFQLNDCDWWAGEDLKSVKKVYAEEVDSDSDLTEDARELTEKEMNELVFADETGSGNGRSFKDQLKRLIDNGQEFPCFFATSEY